MGKWMAAQIIKPSPRFMANQGASVQQIKKQKDKLNETKDSNERSHPSDKTKTSDGWGTQFHASRVGEAGGELVRNGYGDWVVGVIAVIQIVPIPGVVQIHIVGFVPVLSPAFRPGIDDRDPVS